MIRQATFLITLVFLLTTRAEIDIGLGHPPGAFFSLETNKIHLHCIGEGSPIIVFDSGVGGSHLDWVNVQSRAGEFTQACSYDRSGYGWSEMGIKPRTSKRIVGELTKILKIAKKAHKSLGCKGITRSDFRFYNNKFYLLETNTQPGMTKLSLVPEIAKYKGINFENLVDWMIKDASCNR